LGPKRGATLNVAVMDMWERLRKSKENHADHADIVYDKFHVLTHLGKALDSVRQSEYRRVAEQDRSFIKGQKWTLLSARAHLNLKGRQALKKLLAANRRISTAYVLKESFGSL